MLFGIHAVTGERVFFGPIRMTYMDSVLVKTTPLFVTKFWLGAFTCFGYKLVMVCPD